MKQISLSVQDDKYNFLLSLIEELEGIELMSPEEEQGMYSSIVSLQKGEGIQ